MCSFLSAISYQCNRKMTFCRDVSSDFINTIGLFTVQAALVVRGLGIRGFDYSRTRKQGITANSEGNIIKHNLEW